MLVLSRKKEESIYIGPDIEVFVVETRGDRVRLGIRAPREIPILRNEHLAPGSLDDTVDGVDVIGTGRSV